jgi:membrane associated rhomboid family serine protease
MSKPRRTAQQGRDCVGSIMSLIQSSLSASPQVISRSHLNRSHKLFNSGLVLFPRPSATHTLSKRAYSSYGYPPKHASNMRVIWGIIGANTIIFGAWQYALPSGPQQLLPNSSNLKLANFLKRNFITSVNAVTSGRWWTAITAAFSQVSTMHYISNMIALYAFGSVLINHPAVTPFRLAFIALGSACAGSLGFYAHSMSRPNGRWINGLGASGMVMGLGGAAAFLFPRAPMLLYGFIPIPLWGIIAGYFVLDSYYLDNPRSTTAHSGHLGGLGFGLAYAMLRLRRGRVR